jgi:uncharacterized protein YecE (DUF72 family)
MTTTTASIRVGIGGWTYEPWRGSFFPTGLPRTQELAHASRAMSVLEINGTYYSLQKPTTFAKWRDETPAGFVFSVKAHQLTTRRSPLAQGAESVQRFLGSGLAELGDKLGPILWQLPHTKRFDRAEVSAFLDLLPSSVSGLPLRHVLDVRHSSFACEDYVALARERGVATVFTDSPDHPSFADLTGGFVYARMMRTDPALPEGCEPEVFAKLAACARCWRDGGEPEDVPRVAAPLTAAPSTAAPSTPASAPRDVYMLFISGAKERAPAAALALQRALAGPGLPKS